jgi:hypothetical protein
MDFQVVSAPDEFTVVDNTDDWVLYALADTNFTLEFVAVGLNDAALAIAAKDAAIAAADAAAVDAALAQAAAVQTGLDAAATAADRVQTGLDATATAADRVQTGLDATATAADRVQTGLDVIAADAAAALATSVIPTGGTTGQALVKASNSDYDYAWASISGIGDMVAAIYDPTAVGGDAFARANHHGTQLAATISDFSTAADARVSAAIGATVQAYSANLTTWAGIAPSANAQALVGAANYAAMRALLDLEAGTDFLSPAAIAAAYAALVHTHTVSQLSDASANGQSLISAANYAAMRALLDLEVGTDFLSPAGVTALIREKLTANRTYYVRTDGNDANTGLVNDAAGAFLTKQKAINVVAALDISIYNVTIQVGDGTYTGGLTVSAPWIGSGTVSLIGNVTTPANCVISVTSGNCVTVDSYGRLRIGGFKLQTTTSGICAAATNGGNLSITAGPMEYGVCANAHIYAERNGVLVSNQAYTITGGAVRHIQGLSNAYILMSGAVTLTGTPAFSGEFVRGERMALVESVSVYTGAATGTRYAALTGGGINAFAAGINYFPGSAAGAATSPGWYA